MPYDIQGIAIRPVREEELPLLEKLARRIWPETYAAILTPGQIEYMIELMYALPVIQKERHEGVTFELICSEATPIGFLAYGPYQEEPSALKLHKLYLDFAWHGRGIGSMALQHVIAAARLAGYRLLGLNVNKNNTAALRAYERNGFLRVGEVKIGIGRGYFMDDYVMELEL